MATKYTASTASGYCTDVSVAYMGDRRVFMCHYSAPSNDSGYVDPGMHFVDFIHIEDADPTQYDLTSNSVGGKYVLFSGLVTGSTGYMLIMGR